MKTVGQIAKIIGVSQQRLSYWLKKDDAPIPEYKIYYGHMVRIFDEDEIKMMWKETWKRR